MDLPITLGEGGKTLPISDSGTTSSTIPDDPPEVPPILDPIVSEWQRLASMDGQSPNFLPLLSTLTTGDNQSSTIKLQDENARIVLGALDEVGRPLTVVKQPDGDLHRVLY